PARGAAGAHRASARRTRGGGEMTRRRAVLGAVVVAAFAALVWWLRRDHGPPHYTGFVEGEERVVRSEVTGRVLDVPFAEGASVPASAVVARLDDADIRTRIDAKREELDVLEADIGRQEEQVALLQKTWERDVSARQAEVHEAEASADVSRRTFAREQELVTRGASTAQLLDDARARRDQAASALERARQMLGRAEAEEGEIAVARRQADV